MKICIDCKKEKPRGEFYAHPCWSDGLFQRCKSCHRNYVLENRNRNIDSYRERDRDRARRASKTPIDPVKKSARGKARRAIQTGKLKKTPCVSCGNEKTEMHHPDYSKPLDVMWLCKLCHEEWHKQHGDNK